MATIKIKDRSSGSNTSSVMEDTTVWDVVMECSEAYKVVYEIFNSRKNVKNNTILQSFLASFLKEPGKNYFDNGLWREQ